MMNYTTLNREGYAHTYALVNFTTGEVYTTSCEVASVALRSLLKRMDGAIRLCRHFERGMDHMVLANCVTGAVIEEVGN